LAFDNAGNLYVASEVGNTIEKFTPGGVGTVFASYPSIYAPQGLAFDSAGNLYAASVNYHAVEKFTPSGVGSDFVTGLSAPLSLAFDSAGNLYVASESAGMQSWNKIDKFAPDGTYLGLFASSTLNAPYYMAIQPTVIPEPSTFALAGLGAAALMIARRRK
jgi:DNA-binding beta-propeller fold protein YncE